MNILHDAIVAGDIAQVRRLIDEGSDVNQLHSETKESPMMMALARGQLPILQLLLGEEATFYVEASENELRRVGYIRAAEGVLKKALEMGMVIPLGQLRGLVMAQVYEEFALVHLQDQNNTEIAKYFELAIKQLELINQEDTSLLNRLFAFHAQCGLAYYKMDLWESAICRYQGAIDYASKLLVQVQDVGFLKQIRSSLVDALITLADCHYHCANQDKFNSIYQELLDMMISVDMSQRDKDFYSTLAYVFSAWGSHKAADSDLEFELYEFGNNVFSDAEAGRDAVDLVITDYIDMIGFLTSKRGSTQYSYLITPMIQIMTLLLSSYQSEHYGNTAFKEHLADGNNRRRFEAKLEELKKLRMASLQEFSVSSPGVLLALVGEIRELKAINEQLVARVAGLTAKLASSLTPATSLPRQALFSHEELKRPREEDGAELAPSEPQEKRPRLTK